MSETPPDGKYTQLDLIRREEKAFQKFSAICAANEDSVNIPKIYYDITDGDHAAAAVLDEILFWTLPNKKRNSTALRVRKEGILWLSVSRAEWWDRKRLSERQADRGIEKLLELGLIDKCIHRFNGHGQMHLRVVGQVFFDLYGKALQKAFLEDADIDENSITEINDLYAMMGMSDSRIRDSRNGDTDSPNGDRDSPNGDTLNSLPPASNKATTQESAPLSKKEFDKANKKVDAVLEQERIAQDKQASGASWPGRESMPEPIRDLLDVYVQVTGQRATKGALMDWLQSGQDWLDLDAQPVDIKNAYKKAHPKDGSGFNVSRPGSLTRTIGALVGERRVQAQAQAVPDARPDTRKMITPEQIAEARNAKRY